MSGIYVLELNNHNKYYVGKSENVLKRIEQHKNDTDKCAYWIKINGGVKRRLEPITPKSDNLGGWERDETIKRMVKHGFDNVRGWEFTKKCLDNTQIETIKILIIGDTDRCRQCGNSGHMSGKCNDSIEKAEWLKQLECLSVNDKPKVKGKVKKKYENLNKLLDKCPEVKPKKSKKSDIEFQCKFCDRVCRSQNGLDKHYEEYCKKIPKGNINSGVKCYRCGEYGHYANECLEFTDSSEEDSLEEEFEVFECRYCDKPFDSFKGCQFHENVHCKRKYSGGSGKSYSNKCRRCGRDGHYASNCYANTHVRGYYLE